jgi:hypothetical protein
MSLHQSQGFLQVGLWSSKPFGVRNSYLGERIAAGGEKAVPEPGMLRQIAWRANRLIPGNYVVKIGYKVSPVARPKKPQRAFLNDFYRISVVFPG